MGCSVCEGKGLGSACPGCGKKAYIKATKKDPIQQATQRKIEEFKVPSWYEGRKFELEKAMTEEDTDFQRTIKSFLNDFVGKTRQGVVPNKSYVILLPNDSGKRIALYEAIKNYEAHNLQTRLTDATTLASLNSSIKWDDQFELRKLIEADVTFVYGSDFSNKRYTVRLLQSLVKARAVLGRPTIFFGRQSYTELKTDKEDFFDIRNNQKENDKLEHPFIADGVIAVANKKQGVK